MGRPDRDGDRAASEETVREQVAELAATLEALESEVGSSARGRSDSRVGTLLRFTREVTIPAAILLLRTNIEALKLLRRALRYADEDAASPVGDRASGVAQTALEGLDDALTEVSEALSGRPPDDRASELLDRARELQAEVEAGLEAHPEVDGPSPEGRAGGVDVDVEAELDSLREQVEGREPGGDEEASDGDR